MSESRFIEIGDLESLGKFYLQKAVSYALIEDFTESANYIKKGLDNITCDCSGWNHNLVEKTKEVFDDINFKGSDLLGYLLTKAYFLCFDEKEEKNKYYAMDAVERYIATNPDPYSYFVKGRLLVKFNKPMEALEYYKKANENKEIPGVLYRIGRIKEEETKYSGLEDLYKSFIGNYSSGCCWRELKLSLAKNEVELNFSSDAQRKLLDEFLVNGEYWIGYSPWDRLFNGEKDLENEDSIVYTASQREEIVENLLKVLKANQKSFVKMFEVWEIPEDNFLSLCMVEEGFSFPSKHASKLYGPARREDCQNYMANNKSSYSEEDYNADLERSRNEFSGMDYDYERENFNAMTDGHYGDYDDLDDPDLFYDSIGR